MQNAQIDKLATPLEESHVDTTLTNTICQEVLKALQSKQNTSVNMASGHTVDEPAGILGSGSFLAVLVYVDDVLITKEAEQSILDLKRKLHYTFTIKDLGHVRYFLGIEVYRNADGVTLHQRNILDILHNLGLSACKAAPFPLPTNLKLSIDAGTPLPHPEQYRRLIGRLLYLNLTRPDISYAVQHLSQFLSALREPHMTATLHLARYLKGTINVGLFYPSNNPLSLYAYTDADWGSCLFSRKSLTSYCTFLGQSLISSKT